MSIRRIEEPGTFSVTLLADNEECVFTATVETIELGGEQTELIHADHKFFKVPSYAPFGARHFRGIMRAVRSVYRGEPVEFPLEIS